MFLHILFCNFEVKIARNIKLCVQRKRSIKCFLSLTTHFKGFFAVKLLKNIKKKKKTVNVLRWLSGNKSPNKNVQIRFAVYYRKKEIQHNKAMLNKVNIYFAVAYLKKCDAYA